MSHDNATKPVEGSHSAMAAVRMSITSTPRCLPVVRAAAERMASEGGFSPTDAHSISWAVDEALTNVIRHGYQSAAGQPIEVTLEPVRCEDGRTGMRVIVRDFGRQVDPCTIKGRPLDEVRPGGLGVHVIQTVMNEVEYSCPSDGGMLLRMVKYCSPAADGTARPPTEGTEHTAADGTKRPAAEAT